MAVSVVMSSCGGGGGGSETAQSTSSTPSPPVTTTPVDPVGSPFTLSSSEVGQDGLLASDVTCDGTGSTPSLTWRNPPVGTKSFVILMSTDPGDGVLKYNWVNYNLPGTLGGVAKNSVLLGTQGQGSDGPTLAYQPLVRKVQDSKIQVHAICALFAQPIKGHNSVGHRFNLVNDDGWQHPWAS